MKSHKNKSGFKVFARGACLLGVFMILPGCWQNTIDEFDQLPSDRKGAKILMGDESRKVAIGGGKGVHYENHF